MKNKQNQEPEDFGLSNASGLQIKVIGYCGLDESSIRAKIHGGRVEELTQIEGEYTLIYKWGHVEGVITSPIGGIHYFYYYDGRRFVHGQQLTSILRQLRIPWEWDWESLGDLCELENLTENKTLHRKIKRVPPASSLLFNETLLIRTFPILDSFKIADSHPVEAIEILNGETAKWVSAEPYLSLSGGFDSRVILSSMLSQKIFPTLVTLGSTSSSDSQVASQIANRYALKQIRVELDLDDLLENGEHISDITNGSKPTCHWHTFLYPKKALVPADQSFFVGTLGEFARSYYFDKGFLSLLADGFPELGQRSFWRMKLDRHKTFYASELVGLSNDFSQQINNQGSLKRAHRNAELSRGDFLSGGSRYYLEQRVPNFYANGIRMYNDTTQWRSPFHNTEWLKTIWNLNDSWKLGSNWHRLAIKRNYPSLLEFPEEKGLHHKRMLSKAPPLYWMPAVQRLKYKSYDLSTIWYNDPRIQELLLDNHSLIEWIISRSLCEDIFKQHLRQQDRTKAISFLLTLLYFSIVISRVQK